MRFYCLYCISPCSCRYYSFTFCILSSFYSSWLIFIPLLWMGRRFSWSASDTRTPDLISWVSFWVYSKVASDSMMVSMPMASVCLCRIFLIYSGVPFCAVDLISEVFTAAGTDSVFFTSEAALASRGVPPRLDSDSRMVGFKSILMLYASSSAFSCSGSPPFSFRRCWLLPKTYEASFDATLAASSALSCLIDML